jgi:hypothetical protein
MEIQCKLCLQFKDEKEFHHENGKVRRHICWTCRGRRERAQLKLAMFEALGDCCACCGERNPYFLTLDHIKNDGAQHRDKYNEQQIYRLARREGWPRDKYQVLCINCNFAKGHFGTCPHQLGVTSEVAFGQLKHQARLALRTRHDYQAQYRGNQYHKVVGEAGDADPIATLNSLGLTKPEIDLMLKQLLS